MCLGTGRKREKNVMPIVDYALRSGVAPIADSVSSEIMLSILNSLNLTSYFENDLYIIPLHKTPSMSVDSNMNPLISRSRCDVRVSLISNPSVTKWSANEPNSLRNLTLTNISGGDRLPLFLDSVAGVRITELLVPVTLKLSVSMLFKDREYADGCIDKLYQLYGTSTGTAHDIAYTYPISNDILAFLMFIYKSRKSLHADMTYIDYIKNHLTADLVVEMCADDITDGRMDLPPELRLSIRKRLLSCYGTCVFDQEHYEVEKNSGAVDRYKIAFEYTVQFSRPSTFTAELPCVVENEALLADHIPNQYSPTMVSSGVGVPQDYGYFNAYKTLDDSRTYCIKFPWYNDFTMPHTVITEYGFHTFIIGAFTLDGTITEIDLKKLDDVEFHPIVRYLMELHGFEIFGSTGIFNITVFSNDVKVDPDRLELTNEFTLKVAATNTMKRYHFAISMATDLRYIDPKWWKYLLMYRWFFNLVIMRNLNWLIEHGLYRIVISHDLLSLIERCMAAGMLEQHVNTLIFLGHSDNSIKTYMHNAVEFADYICNTRSILSERYLYDEMIDIGISAGCISKDNIPGMYLEDRNGMPITSRYQGKGYGSGANIPFRILTANLTVHNNTNTR
jgi:hypothetical protein